MPPKAVATKSKEKKTTEKEKQYQDEIAKLNREIRILRSNLDPKKIEEELKKATPVSDWNLTNELQTRNRELEYILKQYECSGISSALMSAVPDKELQRKYDSLLKELQQKENQVKELVNQNVKIEGMEKEISQLRRELESSKKELSQQTQNAAVNASKTSEEDLKKELEKLKSSIKERDDAIKLERKTEIEELNRNLDMEKQKFQKLEKGFQEKLKEKEDAVKRKDELIGTLQSSTTKNEKEQKAKIVELEQMLEKLKSQNEDLKRKSRPLESKRA